MIFTLIFHIDTEIKININLNIFHIFDNSHKK